MGLEQDVILISAWREGGRRGKGGESAAEILMYKLHTSHPGDYSSGNFGVRTENVLRMFEGVIMNDENSEMINGRQSY